MLILGRKNNRQNKHLNWKAICTFTFTYKESKWAEKAEIKMQITRTLSLSHSLTHFQELFANKNSHSHTDWQLKTTTAACLIHCKKLILSLYKC